MCQISSAHLTGRKVCLLDSKDKHVFAGKAKPLSSCISSTNCGKPEPAIKLESQCKVKLHIQCFPHFHSCCLTQSESSSATEQRTRTARAEKRSRQESRAVYLMKTGIPDWNSTSNDTNKACQISSARLTGRRVFSDRLTTSSVPWLR